MNRRESTIDLPLSKSPNPDSIYSISIESGDQTFELPFRPDTIRNTGSIALKEIISFDAAVKEEAANEFAESDIGNDAPVSLETPGGTEIDGQIVEQLSGLRRESMDGRNGPEYNNKGEIHTEQENIARYQDWVRGSGRMLDVAWDEGVVNDENLQEWIQFKQKVEKFHGITDFYALSDIGSLRFEVFRFVQSLGVADKAFAAYEAATE